MNRDVARVVREGCLVFLRVRYSSGCESYLHGGLGLAPQVEFVISANLTVLGVSIVEENGTILLANRFLRDNPAVPGDAFRLDFRGVEVHGRRIEDWFSGGEEKVVWAKYGF